MLRSRYPIASRLVRSKAGRSAGCSKAGRSAGCSKAGHDGPVTAILLTVVAVLGLVIGAFLNVVIYRVSGVRVSPRYPLVELGTAVAFVAVTFRLDQLDLRSAIPAYLYFTAVGIALALIDLDCRRLPNVLVLPSYPILTVALAASAWWQHDWWSLARAGIGAATLLAVYLAIVLIHPAGMGLGDVKLSGVIGAVLGYLSWSALVLGAFLGFLLGAVAGIVVIARRRGDRKTAMPFGPFMIAGVLLALFVTSSGDQMLSEPVLCSKLVQESCTSGANQ